MDGTATTSRAWSFLGVRIDELTNPGAPLVVSEATLPRGASPPLHVHAYLDDSFYVLDGGMVVRCGDEVSVATAGSLVQFPKRVPHTFGVMDGPARLLMIHADDSFSVAVHDIGRPVEATDVPTTEDGPSPEELARSMATHAMTVVGPPMEEEEADGLLRALT